MCAVNEGCMPRSAAMLHDEVVVFLKMIVSFVLARPFGEVTHDLTQNYNGSLAAFDFCKLEKLATKLGKAELDVQFFKNYMYQAFGVYPKFISFDLPNVSNSDAVCKGKLLLRTSILRRTQREKETGH